MNFFNLYQKLNESSEPANPFVKYIVDLIHEFEPKDSSGEILDKGRIFTSCLELAKSLRKLYEHDPKIIFVRNYKDMIEFIYNIYREILDDVDLGYSSRFSLQLTCIPYFYSLAFSKEELQKKGFLEPIVKTCAEPNMVAFIEKFKEFAEQNGYMFGTNWVDLFNQIISRNTETYENFIELLRSVGLTKFATELSTPKPTRLPSMPNFNRNLSRLVRPAKDPEDNWTNFLDPEYLKLLHKYIPAVLQKNEQLSSIGVGEGFGPFSYNAIALSRKMDQQQLIELNNQMEKFNKARFGKNRTRDEIIIYDLIALILDETGNEGFTRGNEKFNVRNILQKLTFISESEQQRAVEQNRLPISNIEEKVLEFFFVGMRKVLLSRILKYSLSQLLYATDQKQDKQNLPEYRYKLNDLIQKRKEKFGLEQNELADENFYVKMATAMFNSGYIPYGLISSFISYIEKVPEIKTAVKAIVESVKSEYGLAGF